MTFIIKQDEWSSGFRTPVITEIIFLESSFDVLGIADVELMVFLALEDVDDVHGEAFVWYGDIEIRNHAPRWVHGYEPLGGSGILYVNGFTTAFYIVACYEPNVVHSPNRKRLDRLRALLGNPLRMAPSVDSNRRVAIYN